MNQYEFMIIINPDLPEEEKEKLIENIEKEISNNHGTVENRDDIGKKELAYPIKKHPHGYYLVYRLAMDAKNVKPFEKRIILTQDVLRYFILKLEKKEMEVKNG